MYSKKMSWWDGFEEWNWTWPLEEVVRVIDGDSYELRVDIGFKTSKIIECRLFGADTYEPRGGTEETKALAAKGTSFAIEWFKTHQTVSIRTFKSDSFGRWLIWAMDWDTGRFLHLDLIEADLTTGRYE